MFCNSWNAMYQWHDDWPCKSLPNHFHMWSCHLYMLYRAFQLLQNMTSGHVKVKREWPSILHGHSQSCYWECRISNGMSLRVATFIHVLSQFSMKVYMRHNHKRRSQNKLYPQISCNSCLLAPAPVFLDLISPHLRSLSLQAMRTVFTNELKQFTLEVEI